MKNRGSSAIYIIVVALLVAAALICLLVFKDGFFGSSPSAGSSVSETSGQAAEAEATGIAGSEETDASPQEDNAEADGIASQEDNAEAAGSDSQEGNAGSDGPDSGEGVPEASEASSAESAGGSEEGTSAKPAETPEANPTEAPEANPTDTPAETPSPEPEKQTDASGRVIPAEGEYLYDLETVEATTVVDVSLLDQENPDKYFRSYEISDALFERIYGDDRSFKTYCTVPREHLRYIKVLYHDFEGQVRVGEIMINYLLADDIVYIFEELYKIGYQFELMVLIDDFGADDDLSILHNNTSAFNYRNVTGGDYPSNHAYGTAIDINPYNNPYVMYDADGNPSWLDEGAGDYLDREAEDAYERHMINHSDPCFQLFAERGWAWGGDWTGIIDYQHFEKVIYP